MGPVGIVNEVADAALGRGRAERAGAVDSAPGGGDRLLGEIGADDAHVPAAEPARLVEQDADGVDLLAGRAAGAPDRQPTPDRVLAFQTGQELLLKCAELVL